MRPIHLKSSRNESIGAYLYPKKDFMEKYLFFFENESIKVENCWFWSDLAQIPQIPLGFWKFSFVIYNQNQWDLSKITPKSTIFNFDRLVLEEK